MKCRASVSTWLHLLMILAMCAVGASPVGSQTKSASPSLANSSSWEPTELGGTLLRDPVWVYNDWSSYDELSDNIPLTEQLAMKELNEIVRLQKYGVHFDYYMMDAFWFDPDGAYRTWRKPNWPDGPERWIAACQKDGLKPGLWFSTNTLVKINAAPVIQTQSLLLQPWDAAIVEER